MLEPSLLRISLIPSSWKNDTHTPQLCTLDAQKEESTHNQGNVRALRIRIGNGGCCGNRGLAFRVLGFWGLGEVLPFFRLLHEPPPTLKRRAQPGPVSMATVCVVPHATDRIKIPRKPGTSCGSFIFIQGLPKFMGPFKG